MQNLSSADADYLASWAASKKNMLVDLILNINKNDAPISYIKRHLKGVGESLLRKSKEL